jgi:hypothetical protein
MSIPRYEQLAGVIDGVNLVFTASMAYVAGSTAVFLNGQLILNTFAPGTPWTESNPATGEITFDGAQHTPRVGDVVQMFFLDTTPTLPGVVITEIEGSIEDLIVIGDGVIIDKIALAGTISDVTEALDGTLREVEAFVGTLEAVDHLEGELEECP